MACHLQKSAVEVFIMVVDNSIYTLDIWQRAKNFIRKYDETAFASLPMDLPHEIFDLDPQSTYLRQKISKEQRLELRACFDKKEIEDCSIDAESLRYLKGLVHFFGFDRVKALILSSLVLGNDWKDEKLVQFVRRSPELKAAIPYDKIICYLSNIASFTHECRPYYPDGQNISHQVLENVQRINPDLAIHVDYSKETETCNEVFFFNQNEHNPEVVLNTLLHQSHQKMSAPGCG